LNLRGEQILVVPSLAVPDTGMDVGALGECEAVRLFVDRARAVKADFALDAGNADDVAQVCRRLDGVPLAIELAAARVTAMSPGELARRLDRRFRLLTRGERVASERHQALRAAIDWSYELLTGGEQILLARLPVFAGGWTLEAAEAVCSADPIDANDVFELLAGLVARSLVVADETRLGTRYRLLETIRQYGEERLSEAGEADSLRLLHAEYYAEFAAAVSSHIYGRGQVEWGARLSRERDNLLAAMAYALDSHDVDLAFKLFCRVPGIGPQINEVVLFDPEPLLALPSAAEHPRSAIALVACGVDAWSRGDSELALVLCDQALAAERRLGAMPGSLLGVSASGLRGRIAQAAGATDEAVEHLLDAARRAHADDVPAIAAIYLGGAAQTLSYQDTAAARQYATEGLALARQSGMPYAIVTSLFGLAQALAESDPDQARALLSEASQLETTLGYESLNELVSAVFIAARLDEWATVLRAAGRVIHHHVRSGGVELVYLVGIFNLVARGLAYQQPDAAAVVQGTVSALMHRLTIEVAEPLTRTASDQTSIANFVVEVRRDTTRILTEALSNTRLRELRADGAAMDEAQICAYARDQIDEYMAGIEDSR
jgi:tetratricopeptide (TPR) repeat protein